MNIGRLHIFNLEIKMLIFLTRAWNLPSTLLRWVYQALTLGVVIICFSRADPDKHTKSNPKLPEKNENTIEDIIIQHQKNEPSG